MDLDELKDPWGNVYYATYATETTRAVDTFKTSGPDKIVGNDDDFVVATVGVAYFQPVGETIDKVVRNYHERTGGFIRDLVTLSAEVRRLGVDLTKLKDRWNRDYRITFEVSGRNYVVRFHSTGPNGLDEDERWSWTDDFDIWKNYSDYFYKTEQTINETLSTEVNSGKKPFPKDEAEFAAMLKNGGLDLAAVKDGYGRAVELTSAVETRYVDKTIYEGGKQIIKPATDQLRVFSIRSVDENRQTLQNSQNSRA